jgi:hypothetical protein
VGQPPDFQTKTAPANYLDPSLVLYSQLGHISFHGQQRLRQGCFTIILAGHLLGELSALASIAIANILPSSYLVGVVFYHRLTMQGVVERDEQSRSNYAMYAVSPSHVSKTFGVGMDADRATGQSSLANLNHGVVRILQPVTITSQQM